MSAEACGALDWHDVAEECPRGESSERHRHGDLVHLMNGSRILCVDIAHVDILSMLALGYEKTFCQRSSDKLKAGGLTDLCKVCFGRGGWNEADDDRRPMWTRCDKCKGTGMVAP